MSFLDQTQLHSFFNFKIFANIASVNTIIRRNLNITHYFVISVRLAAGQCKKYFFNSNFFPDLKKKYVKIR